MQQLEEMGERLGREGADLVIERATEYCRHNSERIELTNRAALAMLEAKLRILVGQKATLERKLQAALPVGDVRSRRRRSRCYWLVALVLALAGFYFTALTFDPFRLGAKPYLYCVGIAVALAFLGDFFLAVWASPRLTKALVSTAFLAVISSVGILAIIRGNLFIEQIKSQTTETVVEDDASQSPPPPPRNTFYQDTASLLRTAMLLISIGLDLASGLAVREALRYGAISGEDTAELAAELHEVNQQIVLKIGHATALKNEPAISEATFWQNFYRSLLTHVSHHALTKLVLCVIALLSLGREHAFGQTTVVIAVDLSQSVSARGADEKSEFQKNIDAVTKQLARLQADSHLTIIGITDHSFTLPKILVTARIPADPGYFGERLQNARSELIHAWKVRSANLEPSFRETDIIGALLLAGQIFKNSSGQKILILYSDMRQQTTTFDLASHSSVPTFRQISDRNGLVLAQLKDVRVYALGVDGAGKPISYWQSLHAFWERYFLAAGSDVIYYSPLREKSFDELMRVR